jgi:hypothetical protein
MPNPDYRKMFEDLKPYYPKRADLDKLALIMSGQSRFPDAKERLEHFVEKSSAAILPIPAGYTYLAQFISHDISFDEFSDRHKREDFPWEIIDPKLLKELRNLRKPNFDLETIYGYENPTNRGELSRSQLMLVPSQSATSMQSPVLNALLKLGNTKGFDSGTAGKDYPNDLPRGNACVTAKIVDPRNDENLLLAQTQVAFTKFHNAMVVELNKRGKYTHKELFDKARKLTIRYYQTIILTDFLPRIVQNSVLKEAIGRVNTKKSFYQPDMFMPLEFSVAAFRFAHSMIRDIYNLNLNNPDARLQDMMTFTGRGEMGSDFPTPTRLKLPSIWIINWNSFYEINSSKPNVAELINTEISRELLRLTPKPQHLTGGRASSLATLDLYRGRRVGLPTGQDVARKIGVKSLCAEQIEKLIKCKEIINTAPEEVRKIKERLCKVFSKETPLWFYILAEAEIQGEGKLGAVGSTIVAETIIQLLSNSEYSILQHDWESDEGFLLKCGKTFDMPEMLGFIKRMCEGHYKELYPREFYPQTTNKFDELDPLEKGYQDTD